MALEIKIINRKKGLFKKNKKITYSKVLELTNNEYNLGIMNSAYVNDGYNRDENIEEKSFIIYKNTGKTGRGFYFNIPKGQDEYNIYLNLPATSDDFLDMYKFIKKLTLYIGVSSIEQDKSLLEISEISDDFQNKMILNNILDLKKSLQKDDFITFGAKNPIWLEKEIQDSFNSMSDEELNQEFSSYIDNKQRHENYYTKPTFYNSPENKEYVIGVYTLTETVNSIIPKKPYIPFNNNLSWDTLIKEWNICFVQVKVDSNNAIIDGNIVGQLKYDVFLEKIDKNRLSEYDRNHYIIKGLTKTEIEYLLDKK